MVASAATTLYRVVTAKRGARTFVAVDGGMGDNLEVALVGQRFEAALADRAGTAGGEPVTVVGRHCESGDVLIDEIALPGPRVGDLLAVPVTGAYCFTMANNYNGARRIPVVFASDGAARLVVRRETLADLLRAHEKKVTIDDIQRKVADYFGLKMSDLLSARRAVEVARPWQVAMYLAKKLTPRSLPEIGRRFGGRDHTTVMHAVKRIDELRAKDPELDGDVAQLTRLLDG